MAVNCSAVAGYQDLERLNVFYFPSFWIACRIVVRCIKSFSDSECSNSETQPLLQEAIVPWQRKCEDALYSFLVMGARRPVRRLASLAMARVIAKGDSISIYSRVSSLQGWLAEGKRSEPLSCAGLRLPRFFLSLACYEDFCTS